MNHPGKPTGIVRTIAGQAAQAMRRAYPVGRLQPGQPLRQETIATDLGISRIPVREALLLLEAEGLVRIVPQRARWWRSSRPPMWRSCSACALLLEPRLLRASAAELDADDFAVLREILVEYSRHNLTVGNVILWGELNTEFHLRLYARAEQPRTEAFVNGLLVSSDRYTRIQLSSTDGVKRAEEEHRTILALCEDRRVEEAAALLETHITAVGDALKRIFAAS